MPIPIEDFCEDIVGKAMRGLSLSDSEVAAASGAPESAIQAVRRGDSTDEAVLRAIAPVLKLDAAALVVSAQKSWRPNPIDLDGLAIFNTRYHDMFVNAFLVWDPASGVAAAFDSGADATPMLDFARQRELKLSGIFITHTHGDHVADLDTLLAQGDDPVPLHCNRQEPWNGAELFIEGDSFAIGELSVETRTTWGHAKGGTTFVIRGLARPVAVVGDALFAGSMGGGVVSYSDALRTNREHIFSLPDETVICPGHGPLTTVGEEKRHNPFYPEFKA